MKLKCNLLFRNKLLKLSQNVEFRALVAEQLLMKKEKLILIDEPEKNCEKNVDLQLNNDCEKSNECESAMMKNECAEKYESTSPIAQENDCAKKKNSVLENTTIDNVVEKDNNDSRIKKSNDSAKSKKRENDMTKGRQRIVDVKKDISKKKIHGNLRKKRNNNCENDEQFVKKAKNSNRGKKNNNDESIAVTDTENKHYKKIDVVGDGNCLFRAMSHYLHGNEELYENVRKGIVDFTVENWESQYDILSSTCFEGTYKNANDYRSIMGANKTYGTDYEVGVCVQRYRTSITIFKEIDDRRVMKIQHFPAADALQRATMNLLFSGNDRNGHWMILEEVPSTDRDEGLRMEGTVESTTVVGRNNSKCSNEDSKLTNKHYCKKELTKNNNCGKENMSDPVVRKNNDLSNINDCNSSVAKKMDSPITKKKHCTKEKICDSPMRRKNFSAKMQECEPQMNSKNDKSTISQCLPTMNIKDESSNIYESVTKKIDDTLQNDRENVPTTVTIHSVEDHYMEMKKDVAVKELPESDTTKRVIRESQNTGNRNYDNNDFEELLNVQQSRDDLMNEIPIDNVNSHDDRSVLLCSEKTKKVTCYEKDIKTLSQSYEFSSDSCDNEDINEVNQGQTSKFRELTRNASSGGTSHDYYSSRSDDDNSDSDDNCALNNTECETKRKKIYTVDLGM